jgi:hypothetical protein
MVAAGMRPGSHRAGARFPPTKSELRVWAEESIGPVADIGLTIFCNVCSRCGIILTLSYSHLRPANGRSITVASLRNR